MNTSPLKAVEAAVGLMVKTSTPQKTVEEVFEEQIQQARKLVEELCIKKAKLEALNMHKMPYHEIRALLDHYPF